MSTVKWYVEDKPQNLPVFQSVKAADVKLVFTKEMLDEAIDDYGVVTMAELATISGKVLGQKIAAAGAKKVAKGVLAKACTGFGAIFAASALLDFAGIADQAILSSVYVHLRDEGGEFISKQEWQWTNTGRASGELIVLEGKGTKNYFTK